VAPLQKCRIAATNVLIDPWCIFGYLLVHVRFGLIISYHVISYYYSNLFNIISCRFISFPISLTFLCPLDLDILIKQATALH
jgi:hypothetical protein